jgi:hypothetical protein
MLRPANDCHEQQCELRDGEHRKLTAPERQTPRTHLPSAVSQRHDLAQPLTMAANVRHERRLADGEAGCKTSARWRG